MKYPLVSIIIINWNGGKVYKECLHSLKLLSYPNWELIVVDNGSVDGSDQFHNRVKLQAKRVEYIKNKDNVGFAPANNQGFEVSKGKYILLLNNDTKVSPDLLKVLVEKMEKDVSVGAMQPKIYLMDKPNYLDNAGSFLTSTGFLTHWGFMEKDSQEFNTEKEIFSAKGACLFTRRCVVETVGLFDQSFQSYFEESDFCWRVWLAGWRVIYYPSTYIYHKLGFTSKRMSQFAINYHAIKNRNLSIFKNVSSRNLLFMFTQHIILIIALGIYYLVRLQKEKAGMVFQALKWNILSLKESLKKRNKVQSLRKVKDKEIFSRVMKRINVIELFTHFQRVEENFK